MDDWDGKERRSTMFDRDFYEKMTEMHGDVKHMVKWAEDHDESDDIRFQETKNKVEAIERIVYMGLGGMAVVQFFFHFLK